MFAPAVIVYDSFVWKRTKEVGIYSCCYGVIPGWDQESSRWVFTVLRSHCAVIEIRSLVLARDDESRAQCCICGCKLFIRQKNIRTKGALNARMFVQSSLTNICSFNVVHLRCCGHYSTFVGKNRRSGRLHWLLRHHSWLGSGI